MIQSTDRWLDIISIEDNPKQYLMVTTKARFPSMWGAKGSAKTWSLCLRALALSSNTPWFGDLRGNRGAICRYIKEDLFTTTLLQFYEVGTELFKCLPEEWCRLNKKTGEMLLLPWGSQIVWKHCNDYGNRQGSVNHDFGWVGFDQGEEIAESIWKEYSTHRLRRTVSVDRERPITFRSAFMVGNQCGGWQERVWEQNRQRKNHKNSIIRKSYDPDYLCINTLSSDNKKYLPPEYDEYQRKNLTQREYRIWALGSWEMLSGQIYHEFSSDKHVSEKDSIPYSGWTPIIGVDYGHPSTTMFVFGRMKPNGDLLIYDELALEGEEWIIQRCCNAVFQKLQLHEVEMAECENRQPFFYDNRIRLWMGDPSMRRLMDDSPVLTINGAFGFYSRQIGFSMPIIPADAEFQAGVDKTNHYFRNNKIIINPRCIMTIEHCKSWHRDRKDPTKPARGQEVHGAHCIKYICAKAVEFLPKTVIKPLSFVDKIIRDERLLEEQTQYKQARIVIGGGGDW